MAFDMTELQGLLAQFQPTEEEKRAAKYQAIAQFGLGLLGTRKGEELDRVGRSGAYALQSQGDALHGITQQKMQGMQAAGQAMGLQEQLQKFKDADAMRQAGMEYAQQRPGIGQSATPGAQAAPTDLYQQLLKKADFYESKGLVQQADAIREAAQKFAPKYKGIESLQGPDGKPVVMQTYENQAPTPMQGYMPKPDFKQVDTGGGVGFVDPWTQAQGPAFPKSVSPDAALSSDTARRGQNMTDARARELNAITQGQNAIAGGTAAFNAENKLRDEFTNATKNFELTRDAHSRVLASAQNPSAAGDMSLIFAYMKMLDPQSTVREGEYATARNAGGVPDKIVGAYNRAMNGQILAPDVRKDFVGRSTQLYGKAEEQFNRQLSTSQDLAKRYGLKPENVAQDKRLPANGPQPGTVVGGYTFKGGDPNDKKNWEKKS